MLSKGSGAAANVRSSQGTSLAPSHVREARRAGGSRADAALGSAAETTGRVVSRARQNHLPALDGLRGIAILAVMAYHYVSESSFGADSAATRHLISLADSLWTGVDLFFALSGFLITGILLRAKESPGYFRNFYARRILRIFPLYYGALIVLVVVAPRFAPVESDGVRRIIDSQGWLWAYSENIAVAVHQADYFESGWLWVSHFWSLAVEEHFYLVWPLVVFLCSRRALVAFSLFLIVAAPSLRAILLAHHVVPNAVYTLTPCRIDELAFGGLAAVCIQVVPARRLARWAWGGLGVSFAYLLAAVLVRARPLEWSHWTMLGAGFTALGLGGASLVTLAASGGGGRLQSALGARSLRFFGKYSYGAYVLHTPLQPVFLRVLPPGRIAQAAGSLGHGASQLVGLVGFASLGITVTMLLAIVSFVAFEQPFLRLKRYFEYQ